MKDITHNFTDEYRNNNSTYYFEYKEIKTAICWFVGFEKMGKNDQVSVYNIWFGDGASFGRSKYSTSG